MTKQAQSGNPLDLIRQAGLIRRADQLLPLFQPTIAAASQQVEFERQIPLGASKLGGRPDMPPDLDWPYYYKRPLEFVAQINFAETAPYDELGLLPTSGRLLCFYDPEQGGTDPLDFAWFRVYYDTSDVTSLQRIDYPETAEAAYRPCALTFSSRLTLPELESKPLMTDLQLYDNSQTRTPQQEAEIEAYLQLLNLVSRPNPAHQLLGWPYQIQNDVFVDVEAAATGATLGEHWLEFYQQHLAAFDEWQLLLQIDSDDKANMVWGDAGVLYWCIRREALRNRQFDQVMVVMQCS